MKKFEKRKLMNKSQRRRTRRKKSDESFVIIKDKSENYENILPI